VRNAEYPTNDVVRIGVLASGRGSNFAALLKHQQLGFFNNARLVCLVSNIPSAGALDVARDAGVPAVAIRPKEFASAVEYEQAIIAELDNHQVEMVALAG
jgi:phosphoribosylglycinamide formyltransferase-1